MKIDVQLVNSSNGVFYAGQVVEAVVQVHAQHEEEIRGIKIKYKGKAKVQWKEGSGEEEREYDAKEKYFEHEQWIISGGHILQPGTTHYPVSFILPPNLPSSFESYYGYIRYNVKAKVDREGKDYKVQHPFTVLSHVDLNQDPNATMPAQLEESKMICCLCCATGPVTAVFRIDRCGYVPGEAIIINAEIVNNSDRKLIFACLNPQNLRYFADGNTRFEKRDVAKVEHGPIEPQGSDIWSGDRLIIPPIPPSPLANCNIIHMEYIVELKADVDNTPFDLEVPLSVVIGTVPLHTYLPPPMPMPELPVDPSGIMLSETGGQPPITVQPGATPNVPPPSYSNSVFGTVDITSERLGDERQTMQYTPQYAYYNYGN